jgi:flagellar basal-body rod protein FlgF
VHIPLQHAKAAERSKSFLAAVKPEEKFRGVAALRLIVTTGCPATAAGHCFQHVNTTGFKAQGMVFEDYIRKPDPKFVHHMVLDIGQYRNLAAGTLQKTDNPLDLAISGDGYFAVQTPQGVQYTRNGSFHISADGNIVTADGYNLLSGGGATISIPNDVQNVAIGPDGTISTEKGTIGRLQMVRFANPQGLQATAAGFYTTEEQPAVDDNSKINQGFVEASNVKPIVEMTHIIDISRAYQRVANLINNENERMRNAIRTLGRVV